MASDRHHKHRRASSSSEDEEKSSKRHKHRHHHHKHRRHHNKRCQGEKEEEDEYGIVAAKFEDDIEEGEIRDDDDDGGNLGDGKSGLEIGEEDGLKSENDVKKSRGGSTNQQDDLDVRGSPGDDINGVSNVHAEEDKREPGECDSPSRGSRIGKSSYFDEAAKMDKDSIERERESLSNNSIDHKSKSRARPPSCDRYYDEIGHKSRSRSYDPLRERSRSRSILDEEHHLERRRYQERDYSYNDDRKRRALDSDEEKMTRRHRSRDKRDSERERSVSRSTYIGEDGARHRRDSRDSYRSREIDAYYERRREKERARSRDLVIDRDQRGDAWDRRMHRGVGRERSRERDLDRDLRSENERERGRDRDRVIERDRDVDRERRRERDWDVERGRDLRRERDSERERKIYRSHNLENGRDKYDDEYRNFGRSRDQEKSGRTDRTKDHSPRNDYLGEDMLNRHDNEDDDFEERVSSQLAEQEDEDLNRIEESRRRKQAILEKYKNQLSQKKTESPPVVEKENNSAEQVNQSVATSSIDTATPDGRNGDADVDVADASFSVGKSPQQNGISAPERILGARRLGEGTPKDERSDDMFCDDIFGESPAGVRKLAKEDGLRIERSGLYDNWDDAEGYYGYRFGEVLDGRYEIAAAHGKGVFSTVVRAKDLKAGVADPEEVAVKIIRNNETMYKAGMEELIILKKLVGADPENKRHCVRFLSSFKYRNHLCLVFESLNMNLREVLKKFGRNIGLKLTAVRAYAKQLFIALKHLKNCGVLHCDIKPDNMLVNETKNVLKLCDFGNAMFAGKNEITPYLVSRFYRAPEIILGLPYDHPLDMWSVGCCLYELYTGKVLFPGPSNNDMLRLHMELKGPFPKKMLRKAAFADQHFDHDLNFHAVEEDPVTKKTIKRVIVNIRPKDFGSLIKGSPGEDPKMLANFKDLLEKIFILDPDKRLTVSQALSHPFITGK